MSITSLCSVTVANAAKPICSIDGMQQTLNNVVMYTIKQGIIKCTAQKCGVLWVVVHYLLLEEEHLTERDMSGNQRYLGPSPILIRVIPCQVV